MIDEQALDDIFDAAEFQLSDILPSEWAEQNRFMTSEVSNMEGMFSFDNSPYTKEIIDFFSVGHPCRVLAIMKGAQVGFSTSVLENAIGWIISQMPGNILFLVGHDALVEKAMKKVDNMLDQSGIRHLIHDTSNRAKKNKSGDKDRSKEFQGGSLTLGPTNHKTLRQVSIKYGLIDDFEAMKSDTKESGGTVPMIKMRFASYANSYKLAFLSTPEVRETSNIEPEYLKGDQRKYHVPCPCCGEFITLEWEIDSEIKDGEKAGIYWEINDNSQLVVDSIGYVCQKCDGFFTDQNKQDLLLNGEWRATAIPTDPEYTSYHLSALYAPFYMYQWTHYVKQYLEANPIGQPRKQKEHQAFVNLVLGQTYEPQGQGIDSKALQKNTRPYSIGTIPEKQSIADGNGRIMMITLGSDMNGTLENFQPGWVDDARLDFEVIGWSESGASYSISHGSIGTFQPSGIRNEATHNHPDRIKWSYQQGSKHCVWDELDKVLGAVYMTDTGRKMSIFASGCDTAPYTVYSYSYIENSRYKIYGMKGDRLKDSGIFIDADHKPFMISKEKSDLWIINVNRYKDLLATHIGLVWNPHLTPKQPADFMNFPTPDKGLYQSHNYFSHFEAEHKVVDEKTSRFVWKKITGNHQNHIFDCRIYGMSARDIATSELFKELKIKNGSWKDYVNFLLNR